MAGRAGDIARVFGPRVSDASWSASTGRCKSARPARAGPRGRTLLAASPSSGARSIAIFGHGPTNCGRNAMSRVCADSAIFRGFAGPRPDRKPGGRTSRDDADWLEDEIRLERLCRSQDVRPPHWRRHVCATMLTRRPRDALVCLRRLDTTGRDDLPGRQDRIGARLGRRKNNDIAREITREAPWPEGSSRSNGCRPSPAPRPKVVRDSAHRRACAVLSRHHCADGFNLRDFSARDALGARYGDGALMRLSYRIHGV